MQKPISRRTLLKHSVLVGAGVTLLATPAHSTAPRVLRLQVPGDAENLDPANRSGIADEDIIPLVFCGLTQYVAGDKWAWQPDAAAEIKQVDDTHVSFTLRPGIQWTNGYGELTTDDVKYTFERFLDPALKAIYKGDWDCLDHVDVVDKYKGVLVLKYPFVPLWSSTLPGASGSIICKKAVEKNGGRFTIDPLATSGPYMIKELVPQQRQVLVRNPLWNGPAYEVDEYRMLVIENEKAGELAFEAGELDLVNIASSSVERYRAHAPKHGKLSVKPSVRYSWIGMNTEHPLYKDIRVREAVQQAIDPDEVIQAAFGSAAVRAHGIVPTGLLGARSRNLTKFDPAAAKALLQQAGVANGFSTTLSCMNQSWQLTAAQVVQSDLANVGINVTIKPFETGAFWSLGQQAKGDQWKDLQLYLIEFGMGGTPDPYYASEWFTCDQVGVWNWERVCNPEFDKSNKAALGERDTEKRAAMYVRMQDLMEESGAYVFLANPATAVLYRDNLVPPIMPQGRYDFTLRQTKYL
jgi:peptide/nickel transport system substrate-binding protein